MTTSNPPWPAGSSTPPRPCPSSRRSPRSSLTTASSSRSPKSEQRTSARSSPSTGSSPGDTLEISIFNYPVQRCHHRPSRSASRTTAPSTCPQIGKFYVLGATSDEVQPHRRRRPHQAGPHPPTQKSPSSSPAEASSSSASSAPSERPAPTSSHSLRTGFSTHSRPRAASSTRMSRRLFIIRQIALTDEYSDIGAPGWGQPDRSEARATIRQQRRGQDNSSERLLELIDELSEPASPAIRAPQGTAISWTQPEDDAQDPEVDLIDEPTAATRAISRAHHSTAPQASGSSSTAAGSRSRTARRTSPSGLRERGDDGTLDREPRHTDASSRIPVENLDAWAMRDRTSSSGPATSSESQQPAGGTVYLSGQVNRPGAFDVVPQLTLTERHSTRQAASAAWRSRNGWTSPA